MAWKKETVGEDGAKFLMQNSRLVAGDKPDVPHMRGSVPATLFRLWKKLDDLLERDPSLEDCTVELVEDSTIVSDQDFVIEVTKGDEWDPPVVLIRTDFVRRGR